MPKSPRSKTKTSALHEAVKFASLTCKDEGDVYETHLTIANHAVIGYNRIVALSHPIVEEIEACPQAKALLAALSKSGSDLSITLTNTLSLRSGKATFNIPCVQPFGESIPDPVQADCGQALMVAIAACRGLAEDRFPCVFLNGPFCLATNGMAVVEYWHGLNMPTVALPREFCDIMAKITLPITGVGLGASSITFWFGEAWIKTQLGNLPSPDFGRLWTKEHSPAPIPEGFWKAVDTIKDHSTDGLIRFKDGRLQTHESADVGASFKIGVLPGASFAHKSLKMVEPWAKTLAFTETMCFAYGDNVRGLIMGDVRE